MSENCQNCNSKQEEIEILKQEKRILDCLVKEMNEVCGWGDENALHALLHIKNFIFNLKTDVKVEKTLRRNLVKKIKKIAQEECD